MNQETYQPTNFAKTVDHSLRQILAILEIEEFSVSQKVALKEQLSILFLSIQKSSGFDEKEEAINLARKITLNSCEQLFGGKPNWQFIRRQLLAVFGERGLAGALHQHIA